MTYPIIENTICKIKKSKISPEMIEKVTKTLIDDAWKQILGEVDYAADVINNIEGKKIYDKNNLLIDSNDPVIKPDHTAARGFIDSSLNYDNLQNFDPENTSYDELVLTFNPLTGNALSALILQMLGAKLSTNICNFPAMKAQGTHLFFENTGNIILDKTKHFISNQDIAELPKKFKEILKQIINDSKFPIDENDWENLKKIYKGKNIGDNELAIFTSNIYGKTFSRMWKIDENIANKLKEKADLGEKEFEYAYSTYLRGNMLNHGTWRVSDIYRAQGVLSDIRTNPIPIRGKETYLQQTAGMAAKTTYKTKQNTDIEGPGAFLEVASRPYMLLSLNDKPVDQEGNEVNIDNNEQPFLLFEAQINLDVSEWEDNKIFRSLDNNYYRLDEINNGAIYKNTKLIDKNNNALCYEGFKEANAQGIFFAAGGNIKNLYQQS